ncbi:hypothetical protein FF38_14378 [Lucilia cuprina]|uniref:Uncharacterized protein n=1 Tax=Lucilia cuprina TaxID=7375 RepID=A0A0L0CG42_LUCCU|nr:hypothetical protein FF38_14378 [Lucilia cuprina]
MSSHHTFSGTNFECDHRAQLSNNGSIHRMLKYWRNNSKKKSKKPVLQKSSSFIEYRKNQPSNVIYQRLESYDEAKLEQLSNKS